MTTPQLCSAATRAAGDEPAGSAPEFRTFLLLEYRLPWGRDAASDAAGALLDPAIAPAATAGGAGLRAFAVRPVHDRRDAAPRFHAGQVGTDALLVRLPGPPEETALRRIRDGNPVGETVSTPLIGVCTNGRRDRCCAIAGRPVAVALEAEFGPSVVEISHLGGHRFAATMLVLPWGYAYGFRDPSNAATVVRAALAGLVHPGGLRGRADLSPAAQAADACWRREIGPAGPGEVVITGEQRSSDGVHHVQALVRGAASRLSLRRVDGPLIKVTLCGGKPIRTGRWVFC